MASDLGMSKKTIYERHKSKRELLASFIRRKIDAIQKELMEAVQKETEPVRQMAVVFFKARQTILPFFMALGNDIKRLHPEIWQEIEARRLQIAGTYAAIYENLQKNGYVYSDISPEAFASLLRIMIQSFFQPENIFQQRVTFHELSSGLFKTLLRGIFMPQHLDKCEAVIQEMMVL
jgi:AcrR family transcriptional regulator